MAGEGVFGCRPGTVTCEKGVLLPERLAHESQHIRECGVLLGVPGRTAGATGCPYCRTWAAPQRQPAEEAQQGRGGAQNGSVRPLPLRLHAQIGAHGLKGHFHGPAPQVTGQELGRRVGGVGAEQVLECLRLSPGPAPAASLQPLRRGRPVCPGDRDGTGA